MPHQPQNPAMQECIETCFDCYRTCQQMALMHCLPLGGKHVEPEHFRIMLDCAEICRTTAALMLNGSPFHTQICAVCAEICRACAESCEGLEGMQGCAQTCRRCSQSCEQMAGNVGDGSARQAQPAQRRPQ